MTTYYQTGDVLYIKTTLLPKDLLELKTNLFHKGENHSHLVKGDFAIYQNGEEMFLHCKSECELFHEEHQTITIEQGFYQKRIVMEYDHIKEESRKIID